MYSRTLAITAWSKSKMSFKFMTEGLTALGQRLTPLGLKIPIIKEVNCNLQSMHPGGPQVKKEVTGRLCLLYHIFYIVYYRLCNIFYNVI